MWPFISALESHKSRLVSDILQNYNPDVMPTLNPHATLTIDVSFTPYHIQSVVSLRS